MFAFVTTVAPRNAIDDMKTRFDNMRAELAAKADGFSRRAKKMVERAKAGLVSLDTRWNELTPERRGAIAGALNTAAGKLSSFKDISGDPITALKGAIEIAATFANIAGPHGMVVGVALNFISGFLSLFGLGGGAVSRTPMHLIVRQEIEKWYSEHMTNMARGAIGDFETSQAFLDGVISDLGPDQKLNDSTAIALQIHIPVYRNIAFMENLKAQIEDMKDENRDEDAQKCLKYIELWARMALLKDIILQRMAAIMPESQRSIRAGFYSVQSSLREKARNLFKFLWEAGVGSKIIPYFYPDEKGVVDEYLSTVLEETNYDRTMGGLYNIFVQMAPNSNGTMGFWWATPLVSSEQRASILDGQTHGFPLDFKWKLVPHGNNLFTIISKKDCPDGINCNAYLSWTPDENLRYATVKKSDPVLWEITRSGGEYR